MCQINQVNFKAWLLFQVAFSIIGFFSVSILRNECLRIKSECVWAEAAHVWKAVRKAAGCGWRGDMISALHQQHSNASQAGSGLMLVVFTLQTYILFWQLRIFKMGNNSLSRSVDVDTPVD